MSSRDVDELVEEQLGYIAGRAFRRLLRPEEGEALAQAVRDRGARIAVMEAENARLHGVLMFLGQGVRRLWAAIVNRQYGARSLVGDVALDMKEHMEEAIPGWSVGSTSGTLEATLSSRSDLLANGERLKRALDLACERGAGWRCPADGMQDCPTVRTAPNCVVCWRAHFLAQADHFVGVNEKGGRSGEEKGSSDA